MDILRGGVESRSRKKAAHCRSERRTQRKESIVTADLVTAPQISLIFGRRTWMRRCSGNTVMRYDDLGRNEPQSEMKEDRSVKGGREGGMMGGAEECKEMQSGEKWSEVRGSAWGE